MHHAMILKTFFFFLRVRARICECERTHSCVNVCMREYVCACLVGTTALRAINDKIKER